MEHPHPERVALAARKAKTAADLPPRVAAVTHALMEAWSLLESPVTAAEVCEFDSDALDASVTYLALCTARRYGLALGDHGLWFASPAGWAMRRALEDRIVGGAE